MFRYVIVTLAALGYLACQATTALHSHPSAPAEHGARRHVHLGKTHAASHGHSHHHHAGHQHSHDGLCDQAANPPASPTPHDQDSVYLPDTDIIAAQSSMHSTDLPAVESLDCVDLAANKVARLCESFTSEISPAQLRGGIDLCLILRTLRI